LETATVGDYSEGMSNPQTIQVNTNDLNGIHNALEYACCFVQAGRKEMDATAHEQLLIALEQCRKYTNGEAE
jgi:hypothetical protein